MTLVWQQAPVKHGEKKGQAIMKENNEYDYHDYMKTVHCRAIKGTTITFSFSYSFLFFRVFFSGLLLILFAFIIVFVFFNLYI